METIITWTLVVMYHGIYANGIGGFVTHTDIPDRATCIKMRDDELMAMQFIAKAPWVSGGGNSGPRKPATRPPVPPFYTADMAYVEEATAYCRAVPKLFPKSK